MQTLKRIFNPSAWREWAIVFLAGLVVLTSTACGATQAALPTDNISGTANSSAINPSKSEGMYPHKDNDMDTRAADAKADRMIREANQRIQQGNDKSVGERAEEAGQSVKQAAENIGQSTQRAADNVADNARSLVDDAVDTVDRVTPDRG
ncbi:MAG: hypothetical protein DCF17_08675 [Shackletoniella antarctica]|uniref:Uncharacterized protein n=1 Tax=Shackletoniella antarctica TaxID=268115 RepID=A0A2W4Y6B9_9CYAN|nr:MAG: hypothetical protein DCF17_08675 [Shackletoniella antarctica]